jgi:hypothetical protein
MTTLRWKVIVWVSALVVIVSLLGLPGCKKTSTTQKKTTTSQKDPTKGME